jgi:predicted Fe-S protein YdhL (DUF1289 family)
VSRISPPVEITAATPCNGHCTTVLGDEVCRSCLRTFDEITHWVAMSDDERRAVNGRIADLSKIPSSPPDQFRLELNTDNLRSRARK